MCIQYDFDVFTLIPMMASWHPDEGDKFVPDFFFPAPTLVVQSLKLDISFPSTSYRSINSIYTSIINAQTLSEEADATASSRDETTQPPRRPATGRGPRTECDISCAWEKAK